MKTFMCQCGDGINESGCPGELNQLSSGTGVLSEPITLSDSYLFFHISVGIHYHI